MCMIDQTFLKFVTGFSLILAGSFIVMYVATVVDENEDKIENIDNTAIVDTVTANVIESFK